MFRSRTAYSVPALMAGALLAGAQPSRAAYNFFNPAVRDSIPKLISGTGMYADISAKAVSPDLHHFDVNSPLWTDGAAKDRYIAVPPGASIVYGDTADNYGYPDRAMVIKNFAVDTIPGDPSSRILVETRFTALRKIGNQEKWYLFTYRWRPDQSDADLVPETGVSALVQTWPQGPAGQPFQKKWRFPSVPQCAACHRNGAKPGRVVLAFFTAQINRPLAADPSKNQIDHFFDVGLFTPASARPNTALSPRWARHDDGSASLELRSRSYIAANCSGCHGSRGIASGATPNVTMDFDFHDMRVRTDMAVKPLFGAFPVDSAGLLVPGRPDRSIVLYRQQVRNEIPGDFGASRFAMPPLGSYEPDTSAIKVMSAWIGSMGASPVREAGHHPAPGIRVRDGRIHLPAGLQGRGDGPALTDLRGRKIPLRHLGGGVYRIGEPLRPGIHLLMVEGEVVRRIVP
jgi:hypothetical protein